MSNFQADSLESIYNELVGIQGAISEARRKLSELSVTAANARPNYENAKNQTLIGLFDEEADKHIKRTESHRTAIYRTRHKQLRLEANLAEANLKAERDYLDALKAQMMAIQSRAKILETEARFK